MLGIGGVSARKLLGDLHCLRPAVGARSFSGNNSSSHSARATRCTHVAGGRSLRRQTSGRAELQSNSNSGSFDPGRRPTTRSVRLSVRHCLPVGHGFQPERFSVQSPCKRRQNGPARSRRNPPAACPTKLTLGLSFAQRQSTPADSKLRSPLLKGSVSKLWSVAVNAAPRSQIFCERCDQPTAGTSGQRRSSGSRRRLGHCPTSFVSLPSGCEIDCRNVISNYWRELLAALRCAKLAGSRLLGCSSISAPSPSNGVRPVGEPKSGHRRKV